MTRADFRTGNSSSMPGAVMTAECSVCHEVKEGPVPEGAAAQNIPGETVVRAGEPPRPFVCFDCLNRS